MYRKILNIILIIAISTVFTGIATAQQVSTFNNNITNPFSLNPAMAGINGGKVFLQQRNQWVGIEGAPVLSMLTAEWRLKNSRSAIGLNVSHNSTSILNNTSSYITYASHFKLSKNQNLSFGLSAGIRNNAIQYDQVNVLEDGDQILFDNSQTGTNFDASFGLAYNFKNLEVQFASLQLLSNSSIFSNSFEQKEYEYNFVRHYFGSIAYRFKTGENFNITPMLQARNVQGFNIQPEAVVKFDYKDIIWAAAHYNYKRSVALTVGVAVSDMFVIGYSAEFSTNEFAMQSGGTHEILFGMKFGKSFQTAVNKKEIEKLQKTTRGYDERIEYLKRENERLRLQMKDQKEIIEELNSREGGASYDDIKKAIDEYNASQKKPEPKAEIKAEVIKEQKAVQEKIKSKASSIQFEKGNPVLKKSSYAAIDELIKVLDEQPNAKVEIKGHTDNVGSKASNDKLSQQRSDAIKDYLLKKGVKADRVKSIGMGDSEPIEDNKTAKGRESNRRVEIKILF